MKNKIFSFATDEDTKNNDVTAPIEGDSDGAFLQRLLEETLDHQAPKGSNRDPFNTKTNINTNNNSPNNLMEIKFRLSYLRSRKSFFIEYLEKNLEIPENFSFFKIYLTSSFAKSIVSGNGDHQLFFDVLAKYFGLDKIEELSLPHLKPSQQYTDDLVIKANKNSFIFQNAA